MYKELSGREVRETNYWMKNILRGSAALCVLFGLAVALVFYNNIPQAKRKVGVDQTPSLSPSKKVIEEYFQRNSNVGGFIGGVAGALFSLAGVFLLYLNLRVQNENGERDKVEGRFFELTRLHRENISELAFRHARTGEFIATGRRVFKEIYDQILEASSIADCIFAVHPPVNVLRSGITCHLPEELIYDFAKISLSYNIVLYGVAKDNDNSTFNALVVDFEEGFVEEAIRIYRLVPAKYELKERKAWCQMVKSDLFKLFINLKDCDEKELKFDGLNEEEVESSRKCIDIYYKCLGSRSDKYYKRFGGHQHKIGHYFRHLFQTVKYIDKQVILSYKEKYDYIKTLRGQMSNYEQYVLFYNSLSSVGREWEFNHYKPLRREKFLISKYNLIKNIPDTNANKIHISSFYPLVDFEFQPPSSLRKAVANESWDEL